MNILFVTILDPEDVNSWSGTVYYIYEALTKKHNVKIFGIHMIDQALRFLHCNFSNARKKSIDEYSPIFGEICTEKATCLGTFDMIFFGDLYLAPFIKNSVPIIHLSDLTFHLYKDYAGVVDSCNINRLEKLEKQVLEKYDTIIYSSEWAKSETINYYGVCEDKIYVVEFGANIPSPETIVIDVDTNICNMVFIGKNWQKKGGEKVLNAYKKLKMEGFPCTLTVIGSVPPESEKEDCDLTVIPFLDKSKPEDLARLCNILAESHFLVLPTEFDAFGIVFCEASAYAVPSIAADVGGVSQAVREGKNGYLLPADATADDYALKIKTVFNDKENYLKLRASSRREFETRLNWDVWGEKVNKILEDTVAEYKKEHEVR